MFLRLRVNCKIYQKHLHNMGTPKKLHYLVLSFNFQDFCFLLGGFSNVLCYERQMFYVTKGKCFEPASARVSVCVCMCVCCLVCLFVYFCVFCCCYLSFQSYLVFLHINHVTVFFFIFNKYDPLALKQKKKTTVKNQEIFFNSS